MNDVIYSKINPAYPSRLTLSFSKIITYVNCKNDVDMGIAVKITKDHDMATVNSIIKLVDDANCKLIILIDKDGIKDQLIRYIMSGHKSYSEINEYFYPNTIVFIKNSTNEVI